MAEKTIPQIGRNGSVLRFHYEPDARMPRLQLVSAMGHSDYAACTMANPAVTAAPAPLNQPGKTAVDLAVPSIGSPDETHHKHSAFSPVP